MNNKAFLQGFDRTLITLVILTIVAGRVFDHFGWFRAMSVAAAAVGTVDNPLPVTVVSAASFDASEAVAPEAIVAAFGMQLGTQKISSSVDANPNIPGIQLPTTLGGTRVKINDEYAELFYVSPEQINFIIPKSAAPGLANVEVTANGVVSQGTVEITNVAPAIFTANSTGRDAPAGYLLRVLNGQISPDEPLSEYNLAASSFVPKPIVFGPANEEAYLVLFTTGIRGAADADANRDRNYNEAIHITIDGLEIVPDYVGPHSVFAGLDQINIRIPSRLSGQGRVNLSVIATGSSPSNSTILEFGGSAPAQRPQVQGFNTISVLAGDELTINGAGFSPNVSENKVEIIDEDAQAVVAPIISASVAQIKVRVPFGVGSGHVKVTVRTPRDEQSGASTMPLKMRTSISGFVQDNQRRPIGGLTMRVRDGATRIIETRTSAEGSFVLPDVPSGPAVIIEVDGSTAPANLPLPIQRIKMPVRANRDNLYPSAIEIAPAFSQPGNSTILGALGALKILQSDGITLEIPDNTVARFPDGSSNEVLTLGAFGQGRTPTNLPVGYYSTRFAQTTPFGAMLTPGGKLTFPNSDRLPAGAQVKLFRFDQAPGSNKVGSFIDAGIAKISADGARVETEANAVGETSYYFASPLYPTTTIVGRVLDSDGKPIRLALVQVRGQSTFTDSLGGFILRYVPVIAAADKIAVEVSYLRPTGRVERTQSTNISLTPGGISLVPNEIILQSRTTNRPPVILGPVSVIANQGETSDFGFVASDPDPEEILQVTISGPNFARIIRENNDAYILRLTAGPNDGGNYTSTITVTDRSGMRATQNISLRVNRLPRANAQTVTTGEGVAKAITLTGSDPDGDPITFQVVNNPTHGTLSGTAPNLLYTPTNRYSGSDSFSFKLHDGLANSNVAIVAITITQACSYSISPTNVSVPFGGGNGSVNVSTNGGCSWTASSNVAWITVPQNNQSGNGNGTVNYTVAANSGDSRTGTVTIAGQTFTINQAAFSNPSPTLTNLNPNNVTADGSNFPLTVNGTGFIPGSVVRWNGSDRQTSFVSPTQLTASMLGSDRSTPGTGSVTVFNPSPGGGLSNNLSITITVPPNPAPTVGNINPNSFVAGTEGFITVTGTGFINNSKVRWNGSDRVTNFVSPTQLTAFIPGSDVTTPGTASVTVFNPAPGGGSSNSVTVTITGPPNPVPTISSIDPSTEEAGGSPFGFQLTINGTGFIPSSVVRWNGSPRGKFTQSPTQITIFVKNSDLATPGTVSITVFNPAPGGGLSNSVTFTITDPSPGLTSVSPSADINRAPSFIIDNNGMGFFSGSVVRWNGANSSTTYVSATQLTAFIPASDIAIDSSSNVTVFNPGPGGGTSNSKIVKHCFECP